MRNYLNLRQQVSQKPFLSASLQQALQVLAMPIDELSCWIEQQIMQNPLLELEPTLKEPQHSSSGDDLANELYFSDDDFTPLMTMDDSLKESLYRFDFESQGTHEIAAFPSPYTILVEQIRYHFFGEEREIAYTFMVNIDEKGFMPHLPDELKSKSPAIVQSVLEKLRLLQPIGIASQDMKEFFLVQLKVQNRENTLLYHLISTYYRDLLLQRFFYIKEQLQIDQESLQQLLKELKKLKRYPLEEHNTGSLPIFIPDITIRQQNDHLRASVTALPVSIKVCRDALMKIKRHQFSSIPDKRYYRRCFSSVNWLRRALASRRRLLETIGKHIIEIQKDFFLGESSYLIPDSIRRLSSTLGVHESTVFRAIQDKYLSCQYGIFPLKMFFPSTLDGKTSSQQAKELLKTLIAKENPKKPLTDQQITEQLIKKGIDISRRTVSKYRRGMGIAPQKNRMVH